MFKDPYAKFFMNSEPAVRGPRVKPKKKPVTNSETHSKKSYKELLGDDYFDAEAEEILKPLTDAIRKKDQKAQSEALTKILKSS